MSALHSRDRKIGLRNWLYLNLSKLFKSEKFQLWAANIPVISWFARAEGEAIFDLVMGFVSAQVLWALVELRVLHALGDAPKTAGQIASDNSLSEERAEILMNGGVAIGLMRRNSNGFYVLSRKGASLLGVPGLTDMIRHHAYFYRDMSNPIALLRDEVDTELSQFWPYVFDVSGKTPATIIENYSNLMASSQKLVAHDTLKMVSLKPQCKVLDIGGGSGNFAIEIVRKFPKATISVFDLPEVEASARARLKAENMTDRISFFAGSFRDDLLPEGFDVITLIRVLYDHADSTVMALLKSVYNALPRGGRLVISEPMSGGKYPHRAGDVYFAFYTMAMRTGKARSPNQIAEMCRKVGFKSVFIPKAPRKFITSAVVSLK